MSGFDYKPGWKDPRKYGKYFNYFAEYVKYGDFKSLKHSLNYIFAHKFPKADYVTSSGMGKYLIRKGSNDFQFINYAYEKSIKDYFVKNMDTFDVFIDVGACIGEYDIWLARHGKRCIAVEPVSFKSLRTNIEMNNLQDKIKVFACGVGAKKDRVYFEIMDHLISSSHYERESGKEPNVDIERIDDLATQFGLKPEDRVILKLDVEGMEAEAIAGAVEFIRSRKDLRVIYEHFEEDNFRNDKALLAVADFDFATMDEANRIAIKKA
ncbi:MAG: FkbM family methyltransferase [Niastella sp.]|jgi:FkbM family methyltransferase|nr:FkbM family methyltransferase [Niastella sp.]